MIINICYFISYGHMGSISFLGEMLTSEKYCVQFGNYCDNHGSCFDVFSFQHAWHFGKKITIPLSMIMIGSSLAEIKKDEYVSLFTTTTLWISAGAKLLVIPFLLFPFMFLNVPSSLLVLAALISGMPSAPTTSLFSYKYGANANYASLGVFLSTL
ncbi:AEC family transporter [Siminovitchia sp. FSL H7-0308]|uniref:Uncharacterized protein n=1 Tax=Siminovitchia thermophila TaxID=1245522 RepID=A0ABS2R9R4_9BACI|nr:AEC family transporter [Siminovitchia thermophila]MBM7716373.1 hypothetical protein [Siminovitchia thermophila]